MVGCFGVLDDAREFYETGFVLQEDFVASPDNFSVSTALGSVDCRFFRDSGVATWMPYFWEKEPTTRQKHVLDRVPAGISEGLCRVAYRECYLRRWGRQNRHRPFSLEGRLCVHRNTRRTTNAEVGVLFQ